jgi:hypothetical protein
LDRFHKTCGSSHILNMSLIDIPPPDTEAFHDYVALWFGAHGAITEACERIGRPLEPLPFPGALYTLMNPNSHSRTNTLLRQYVFNKSLLRAPMSLPARLSRLRRIDSQMRAEFFGETHERR